MTPGWGYAASADARRRWRGLLLLALVVGVASGAVLAVAAAARRTDTAYDRLAETTLRYDVTVQDDSDGFPTLEPIADLPGVIAYDRIGLVYGFVDGEQILIAGGTEGDFGYRMDRPDLSDGRLPEPDADDEIIINELSAETFGLDVGDTLTVATMTPDEFAGVV